jgi:hypothetical protein
MKLDAKCETLHCVGGEYSNIAQVRKQIIILPEEIQKFETGNIAEMDENRNSE